MFLRVGLGEQDVLNPDPAGLNVIIRRLINDNEHKFDLLRYLPIVNHRLKALSKVLKIFVEHVERLIVSTSRR